MSDVAHVNEPAAQPRAQQVASFSGQPARVEEIPAGWQASPAGPSARGLLALQSLAGNRAVGTLLRDDDPAYGRSVQRQHPPAPGAGQTATPDPQVADLGRRVAVLEKQQAAAALDLEYRGIIGGRLSAYRQSIYRLTGGLQTAANGYQAAMQQQLQMDAIENQVFAMVLSIGAAGLAEPFLAASLGALGPRLGVAAKSIPKMVEVLENPLNAASAGGASTVATALGGNQANAAQPPAVGGTVATAAGGGTTGAGDAVTFLTANLEHVEHHSQAFDTAFTARATAQAAMTPDQWASWTVDQQRARYALMVSQFDAAAPSSPDALKAPTEIAATIERYMWASWIKSNFRVISDTLWGDNDQISGMGSYIEDRLNALGISRQAGVELTGHWYSANSSHAAEALKAWADHFAEHLTNT